MDESVADFLENSEIPVESSPTKRRGRPRKEQPENASASSTTKETKPIDKIQAVQKRAVVIRDEFNSMLAEWLVSKGADPTKVYKKAPKNPVFDDVYTEDMQPLLMKPILAKSIARVVVAVETKLGSKIEDVAESKLGLLASGAAIVITGLPYLKKLMPIFIPQQDQPQPEQTQPETSETWNQNLG